MNSTTASANWANSANAWVDITALTAVRVSVITARATCPLNGRGSRRSKPRPAPLTTKTRWSTDDSAMNDLSIYRTPLPLFLIHVKLR